MDVQSHLRRQRMYGRNNTFQWLHLPRIPQTGEDYRPDSPSKLKCWAICWAISTEKEKDLAPCEAKSLI